MSALWAYLKIARIHCLWKLDHLLGNTVRQNFVLVGMPACGVVHLGVLIKFALNERNRQPLECQTAEGKNTALLTDGIV